MNLVANRIVKLFRHATASKLNRAVRRIWPGSSCHRGRQDFPSLASIISAILIFSKSPAVNCLSSTITGLPISEFLRSQGMGQNVVPGTLQRRIAQGLPLRTRRKLHVGSACRRSIGLHRSIQDSLYRDGLVLLLKNESHQGFCATAFGLSGRGDRLFFCHTFFGIEGSRLYGNEQCSRRAPLSASSPRAPLRPERKVHSYPETGQG